RELTNIVHQYDGTIVAQINHGGIRDQLARAGPSEYIGDGWRARELDEDEIVAIIEAFGDAAERVMQAGFDGVQLHGAHGYLVSQFLSGAVNRRSDRWGGSLDNRMRILTKIYDEVRKRIGKTPVMLKMNCDDFSPNGFTIEESTIVAKTMADRGIDLLEISGRASVRHPELYSRAKHEDPDLSELSFAGHAAEIRKVTTSTPLALVEGFTTLNVMQAVVDRGIADLVSLSRPLIREPDLVKRLQSGQLEVGCIRCNACSGADVFGKTMLRCQLD
ncbi:MAG: NADH:flavin oxidoreductase, partial [Candidatus Thorarchaeota archaeon]